MIMARLNKATLHKPDSLGETLAYFITRYQPPYIAQVLEGVESHNGACSVSVDELLTVHKSVQLRRIRMRDSKGKHYFLPVDNSTRVEIVPKTRTRLTKSFGPHLIRTARFLRVLRDVPELKLNEGDVLEPFLFESTSNTEAETLKCKILRQPGKEIRLPLHWRVPLESFQDFNPRSYTIRYVADNIAFPVAVRFVGNVVFYSDVTASLRGEFYFEEVVEETIVIATTGVKQDQFTILKLPLDLPVTLYPIKKLHCDSKYINRYWKYLQEELDKLEKQITTVDNDLLPSSHFENMGRVARLHEEIGDHLKTMRECQPAVKGLDKGVVVPKPNLCEDFYEPMMPSLINEVDKCMPFQEEVEHNYEAMSSCTLGKQSEYASVFDGGINSYDAVEPLPCSVPYSSAKRRQSFRSKSVESLREEPFYSSLTSIFQGASPLERPPHVYEKLENKSSTALLRKTKSKKDRIKS
ncbi:uncharacterized protein LOC111321099 [Stylophora pistillata]|uniref:uncharacterized protein LOC111321099 n=1 Tax=Stylophora pistillata TaxID=50429 RepID=UPI000C050BBB|nr:uncharacterized protein LOC111321099 [Stylophora pistillata]